MSILVIEFAFAHSIDDFCFFRTIDKIPGESVSVALILDAMLGQVCATVDASQSDSSKEVPALLNDKQSVINDILNSSFAAFEVKADTSQNNHQSNQSNQKGKSFKASIHSFVCFSWDFGIIYVVIDISVK